MATTMPAAAVQAPHKSLGLPLLGEARRPSADGFDASEARWILPLVADAIDATMQRKEAAYRLGIDAGNLTKQLQGDGHLSTLRLGALPPAFWLALIDRLRAHYGLDDRADRIRQASDLISRGIATLISEATR